MNCAQCGKEIPADSEFCGYCGAAAVPSAAAGAEQAAEATSAAQPPPPPPPPPPSPPVDGPPPPPAQAGAAPPAGAGMPPGQYGPPAKKSPLPWILGILGVVVVVGVVVVLLLGFAVGPKWFAGDDNGGGGGASANPEQTVEAFFEALERRDAEMLIGTMEPSFAAEIKDILGDEYLALLDDYFFTWFPEDLEITITKMETNTDGDTAEVTIKEGTMSYTEDGERVTEEAAEADMDAFELVKVDGKWYLSEDFLIEMGFDFSGYEDLDLDDMDLDELDTELDDGYYDDMGVELPIDSEDEALTVVFEDSDIWDWYMETDGAYFDVTDENTSYVVYLYEIDEDYNEIPYGYFAVDKETGEMYEVVE
ncbi:MAG: zinc ribbon domain-containing protein [Actinobacteria bacterium]|nr:zinc ribbon domain-containing protein [Actinomycetota bacterium]